MQNCQHGHDDHQYLLALWVAYKGQKGKKKTAAWLDLARAVVPQAAHAAHNHLLPSQATLTASLSRSEMKDDSAHTHKILLRIDHFLCKTWMFFYCWVPNETHPSFCFCVHVFSSEHCLVQNAHLHYLWQSIVQQLG